MPISNIRPILDIPVWQSCGPLYLGGNGTSSSSLSAMASCGPKQIVVYPYSGSIQYIYYPTTDSSTINSVVNTGSFGCGSSVWHPAGPTGTASAGTSTTITTATTVAVDLSPDCGLYWRIRITGGTGAGQERLISSATLGTNSMVTVTAPWDVTPDGTSTYQLMTGRYWFFSGGTISSGVFKYLDWATQTSSGSLSVTGLPASWATDGKLAATPSLWGFLDSSSKAFASGTATSATSTTLSNSAKTWATNQWIGYQVRITSGLGAGQVRTITASDATSVTVATWTVTPDATSTYALEGNDDYLYLIGNGAITMYRYSISGNSWSTISPSVPRTAVPTLGSNFSWIPDNPDSLWTNESSILNGRRLYSFRGSSVAIDVYDIPSNSWSTMNYSGCNEYAASAASSATQLGKYIYWLGSVSTSSPHRFFRFDTSTGTLEPYSMFLTITGAGLNIGYRMWITRFQDGTGSPIDFLYQAAVGIAATVVPMYRRIIF